MKRVMVVLSLILLLAGSIPVFADPHALPVGLDSNVSTITLVEVE